MNLHMCYSEARFSVASRECAKPPLASTNASSICPRACACHPYREGGRGDATLQRAWTAPPCAYTCLLRTPYSRQGWGKP